MSFIEYYSNQSKQIIKNLTLNNIVEKKKELLKSVDSKDINSPSIKEVKNIISKMGIDFSLEEVIPQILDESNVFATFFYGKSSITESAQLQIIQNYLLENNLTFGKSEIKIFHPGNGIRWFEQKLEEFLETKDPNINYILFFTSKFAQKREKSKKLLKTLQSNPKLTIYE